MPLVGIKDLLESFLVICSITCYKDVRRKYPNIVRRIHLGGRLAHNQQLRLWETERFRDASVILRETHCAVRR